MENTKEKLIASTEQIKTKWESLSHLYSKYIAPNFRTLVTCLSNVIDAESGDYIVETGCGEGILSTELALGKKIGSELHCIDLTMNMCKYTAKKLSILEALVKSEGSYLQGWRNKVWEGINSSSIIEYPFEESKKFESINTTVHQGNSEDIRSIIPDEVADKYISSLCLQIVNNPDNMINESIRVLKKGGKAAFSVWGN